MWSGDRLGVKFLAFGGAVAQARACQQQPVRVMHQAVEDGVGERGIADDLVPMFDGQLAGHDGGLAAIAILNDLQEIAALLGGQRA